MSLVKKTFSIKDLENLSGIKAHTIRIWEKRYNLLSPERTQTNIRLYSLLSLQKLLNITLLYENGLKISKIAQLKNEEIPLKVREIIDEKSIKNNMMNAFKLSMINFDQSLFYNTYNKLVVDLSFREIFKEYFIPLLQELGYLWQSNTISTTHEHFITNLVKQKVYTNTEKVHRSEYVNNKSFVLFLPENEIHELGILYLNYELNLRGYKSIFLGQSVPIENLEPLIASNEFVEFIAYVTVEPSKEKIDKYLQKFKKKILDKKDCRLSLLGFQTQFVDLNTKPENVSVYRGFEDLIEALNL
ncbi:MerR family transcriptional regulator [Flavobacteriaceae bacterium]|jgi:DNA-binding transcriptional MerR regulator|nr:MAG: MerR family transcriptional regulator [Polaribacter sp. BACL8 MAG-120531-bin13]KRP01705.1 MAG: MerR family transcriptional regulator [Polaribacter sp. BACL8 MAG-120619-bin41]MBT7240760.1 MerR family transcriptional regulator [Flavobacteriaceae bacterium]NQV62430.1 MerR family transcriptional regulator [Cryomorphaceae bacterium]MDA9272877.1 MerR family transcriptional regulator [Flavobacteriaceae bacterium]|tara:strand:- start:2314 stop:3216 length:903 start_codon:yes stop_codon:yes gene_type:complete